MQLHLLNSIHLNQYQRKQHRHHLQMNQRHHQHQSVSNNNLDEHSSSQTMNSIRAQQRNLITTRKQIQTTTTKTNMINSTTISTASSRSSSLKSNLTLAYLMLVMAQLIATVAFVQVEAKPLSQLQVKFRAVPRKEVSAALGASVTFECQASSSPPPTIHWLKNGKRIIQNDLDENRLDDGSAGPLPAISGINSLSSTRSRLFVDCIDFTDEATYTCVAENPYSRLAHQSTLNVIRPQQQNVEGQDDLVSDALSELAAASNALKALDGVAPSRTISAVPQCISDRLRTGTVPQVPARIHMWTHNVVETMKNNVVLMCRSNIKPAQDINLITTVNSKQQSSGGGSSESAQSSAGASGSSSKATITWTLPDDKVVTEEQRDKYEVLDTGDLLIKDLNWNDTGNYVCSVSDEQSSDSVGAFVYTQKPSNSKRASSSMGGVSSGRLLTRFR